MQRIRRLAAVAGVTAMAGAFIANPAGAATKEVYLGSAAARGLNITVSNPVDATKFQATLGSATARVTSALQADATGIGQVVPELADTKKSASVSGSGKNVNGGTGCAVGTPVEQLANIVNLGVACGSATASTLNGLPIAESKGSVAGLTLDGSLALDLLGAGDLPIGETLNGVLDEVCSALDATCDATTTVKDVVASVLKTQTLNVAVGESVSKVTTTGDKVTSSATASGAVIRILPLPQVNGLPSTEPLATIEVSSAKATAVYDRAAGTSLEPTADPALVRVKFNTVLTQALGVNELAVQPNKTETILTGTPLQSTIRVAGWNAVTNADGTKGVVADSVRLHLLQGLGATSATAFDGGIVLELAHAEAGVAGAPAVNDPPRIEIPRGEVPPAELPRTGGTPWIPLAGAAVLALAVVARRASLRAATVRIED